MSIRLLLLALTFLLNACLSAPQTADLHRQQKQMPLAPVLLSHVPFFAQTLYQCGPASLAMLLQASQVTVTPEQLISQVYVPQRQGSFQVEMLAAARSHGVLAYVTSPSLTSLIQELQAGHAVLVLQNLGLSWYPQWHFAVVKGFDLTRGRLILNSGLTEDYDMRISTFERTWARSSHWAMLALTPGTLPAHGHASQYFSALAAFEQNNSFEHSALAYHSGVSRWPDDINLRMGYGNLLYSQQQLALSAEQFSDVLLKNPDYAPAHNNLAQVLFEQGLYSRAHTHARTAVSLGGEYLSVYLSTLQTIESQMHHRE